jgi:hypothetical protein
MSASLSPLGLSEKWYTICACLDLDWPTAPP